MNGTDTGRFSAKDQQRSNTPKSMMSDVRDILNEPGRKKLVVGRDLEHSRFLGARLALDILDNVDRLIGLENPCIIVSNDWEANPDYKAFFHAIILRRGIIMPVSTYLKADHG